MLLRLRGAQGTQFGVREQMKLTNHQLQEARKNGSYGGQERASRHSRERLSEWASRGGEAVLAKYGPDYFVELRKRRKYYFKSSGSRAVQPGPRVVAARDNGQLGGFARAAKCSPAKCQEWARRGGLATRAHNGKDFYREIRRKRKNYPKLRRGPKMQERRRKKQLELCNRMAKTEPDPAIAGLWKAVARAWEPEGKS